MKKFRFLFVVAVIAAIFVVPSFATDDSVFFEYDNYSTGNFVAPSLDSLVLEYPNYNIFLSITSGNPFIVSAYASTLDIKLTRVSNGSPIVCFDSNGDGSVPIYSFRFDVDGSWHLFETLYLDTFYDQFCVYSLSPIKNWNKSFVDPVPVLLPEGVIAWDGDTSVPSSGNYYRVAPAISDSSLETSYIYVYANGYLSSILPYSSLNSYGNARYSFYVKLLSSPESGTYFYYRAADELIPEVYVSRLVYSPPDPMGEIMDSTTSIFDSGLSMMASVANAVTSSPLILLIVLIPLIFVGVSLFRRFMKI